VILALLAVLSLALAAFVGPRLYAGSPSRSAYCKVLPCDELDSYDAMCRAASIAELGTYDTVEERYASIRGELAEEEGGARAAANFDRALEAPRTERYPLLEGAARESGAPAWTCPALQRAVTSTVP
jgi:hypothetical protein